MSEPVYAYIEPDEKSRRWQELPDFRFIMAVQGQQTLGPALQRAWRCMEDGAIEWRTIPTHMVSVADYTKAVAP